MTTKRLLHCRSFPLGWSIIATTLFVFSIVPNLMAQETIATTDPAFTSTPSSQPSIDTASDSTPQPLNPVNDSNLHSTLGPRNEVSADPRRFQYGLQVTMRGVYDDNINISQTGHVSDYYFTIEPTLT